MYLLAAFISPALTREINFCIFLPSSVHEDTNIALVINKITFSRWSLNSNFIILLLKVKCRMPERQCYQYAESVAPEPILEYGLWKASGIKQATVPRPYRNGYDVRRCPLILFQLNFPDSYSRINLHSPCLSICLAKLANIYLIAK